MKEKLLLGLGVSNLSVADYLRDLDVDFKIFIDNPPTEHFLEKLFISNIDDIDWSIVDEVIKSPGIAHTHPVVIAANTKGIPVSNEIGFTTRFFRGDLIAITGSNGKTTTTSLVSHLLNHANKKATAVGNIGRSFLEAYTWSIYDDAIYVAELSSFQLKDLKYFNPSVSVVLNLKSAHLDYHSTLDDYHNSKMNIFRSQQKDKPLVFNLDDEVLSKAAFERGGVLRSFSCVDQTADCYYDGFQIFLYGQPLIAKSQLQIKGDHNIQNTMAAILSVCDTISVSDLVSGLMEFTSVAHRLEKVNSKLPIDIYNDSKSTNTTAVKAALSSFDKPVVLLMGGLDRGNDFKDLNEYWSKTSKVISFGQSAEKIHEDAKEHTDAVVVKEFSEAINLGIRDAIANNQTLVFSPGCASWDAFENFEIRGLHFKANVLKYDIANK